MRSVVNPARSLGPLCALGTPALLLEAYSQARLLDCRPMCSAIDCDSGGISPLYGELLPEAVTQIVERLGACSVVVDLGCGQGKLVVQLFVQQHQSDVLVL